MEPRKIRIVKKNDEYSQEYQVGDILTVEGTWYGGVHAAGRSGVPVSLDREEYEEWAEQEERRIDPWSYQLGVMDCFCEMVANGLKKLAMSHPFADRRERDSYLAEVKRLCGQYGILYYAEDEAFVTELFPRKMSEGMCLFLFFRTQEVLEEYRELRERQRRLMAQGTYTVQAAQEIAREFGRLLSYPEDGIERLIRKPLADAGCNKEGRSGGCEGADFTAHAGTKEELEHV